MLVYLTNEELEKLKAGKPFDLPDQRVVYLTKEEVAQLKAGKPLDIPDPRFNLLKVYEPEPIRELTEEEIAQANIELSARDEQLAGMEA